MLIREVLSEEKEAYNRTVCHVIQSFEWGEFRKAMGVQLVRLGFYEGPTLTGGFQLTFHLVPYTSFTVGYFPKGPAFSEKMITAITDLGKKNNAIFIKIEPNVIVSSEITIPQRQNLVVSQKPMFTKYTFLLDLSPDEEMLLSKMKEKTRYNVRLAQKKGVVVTEETSQEGFKIYLQLLEETIKRDRFFAHDSRYHQTMWDIMSKAGIAHLLIARYQNVPLAAWILFKFHDVLYYPYGTSSRESREVMAPNLMMWEAIRLGKKLGCSYFDMWGALGPNPDQKDPFYGFHRFKEGYGGQLVEFVGSYDLVLKPQLYSLYNVVDKLRWKFLKLKQKFF